MIKIITANIGGLNTKEKLKKIIEGIKKYNPDIVLLQEVIKKHNKNALSIIQKEVNYPFEHYEIKQDMSKDYGKGKLQEESETEGLAILSKQKFKATKTNLPIIIGEDRWPRIAVKYEFKNISICNLHLSKIEESRTMAIKELPKADVYAGDFNMQPDEINSKLKINNSYNFEKYISYYSKNITLDYVLLKNLNFKKVEIIEKVSDHNGLYVEIKK